MEIPCGRCRDRFRRFELRRVRHRLLCPLCLTSWEKSETGAETLDESLEEGGERSLNRLEWERISRRLFGKTLLLLPFFLWARASETGAAALQGVVAGEVVSFLVLALVDWPTRGVQIRRVAVYEFALLVLFWNRDSLLEINDSPSATAYSAGFFMAVILIKAIFWGARNSLEAAGITTNE